MLISHYTCSFLGQISIPLALKILVLASLFFSSPNVVETYVKATDVCSPTVSMQFRLHLLISYLSSVQVMNVLGQAVKSVYTSLLFGMVDPECQLCLNFFSPLFLLKMDGDKNKEIRGFFLLECAFTRYTLTNLVRDRWKPSHLS